MSSNLSTYDRFNDHVEIIGYTTTGISGILFLTYFTLLFFSKSVQEQDILIKLIILAISLVIFVISFFIPLHKNKARLLMRTIFLFLCSFSFFEFFDKGTWYFGLIFSYTLYGYWIFNHPMVISFFRPLKPREISLQKRTGWFVLHYAIITLLSLVFFLKGWSNLLQDNQDQIIKGLGYLGFSFILFISGWGLRRLYGWARWLMFLTSAITFMVLIPNAFNQHVQNYIDYWKALLFDGYFCALALYLAFAGSIKTAFHKKTVAPQDSA